MAQSIFLNPFVDELVRLGRGDAESHRARFRQVVLEAAQRFFGTSTPLRVEIEPRFGQALVYQSVTVVERISDPAREVSLESARALDPGVEVGDELDAEIAYTEDKRRNPPTLAPFPLPVFAPVFWDVLNTALSAELVLDFPAPCFAPGTLGALLQAGGDWMVGLSATAGGVTLTIERATWDYLRLTPTSGWIECGFDVRVEGADPERSPKEVWQPKSHDNDGISVRMGKLPVDPCSREHVIAVLSAFAQAIAESGTDGQSEYTAGKHLFWAALKRPAAHSLMSWASGVYPEVYDGRSWTLQDPASGRRILRARPGPYRLRLLVAPHPLSSRGRTASTGAGGRGRLYALGHRPPGLHVTMGARRRAEGHGGRARAPHDA
jgi:hypothetical protein